MPQDNAHAFYGQVKVKQDKEDSNLQTTSKEIVGAINELKTEIDGVESRLNSLNGN